MSETTPETSDLRERLTAAIINAGLEADGSDYAVADALLAVVAQEIAAAEQREREAVVRALFAARVVCPVHGIPDCGPLLNGCSVPRFIAEWRGEFIGDLRAALAEPAAEAE